jgi:hypothetical protein
VARLAERFRLHRAKQEPAGRKALAEAVAGREGWHAPRDVMGGVAAHHGPTGARVRADSGGTMFDVLAPGSELHSSHATAGEAVRAAEVSGRFGTGDTTAEREHAARQEAIAKSRERAAQAQKPTVSPSAAAEGKQPHEMTYEEFRKEHPAVRGWHSPADRGVSSRALDPNIQRRNEQGFASYTHPLKPNSVFRSAKAATQAAHRTAVESALAAGKHVPAHVLADYPDLAARHAPFSDADAPLRPVRFVPLAQPLASAAAPGGQEDARR